MDDHLRLLVHGEALGQLAECHVHLKLPRRRVGLAADAHYVARKLRAATQADRGRLAHLGPPHHGFVDARRHPQGVGVHQAEDGGTGHQGVADLGLTGDDQAVHGRTDAGEGVEYAGIDGLLRGGLRFGLACREGGGGTGLGALGRLPRRCGRVHGRLGDVARAKDLLVALEVALGELQIRPRLGKRRLRRLDVALGGGRCLPRGARLGGDIGVVELRKQLPRCDAVPLIRMHRLEDSGDARADRDRDAGGHYAGAMHLNGDLALFGLDHRHRGGVKEQAVSQQGKQRRDDRQGEDGFPF
jgi:hypothetical protein